MKNTLLKIATVLVLGISMFSCSPEDGKDGIDGVNGTNGTNGNTGPTGTANVIYSAWIPADFIAVGSAYRFTIPLPASISYTNILNTYYVAMFYDQGSLQQLPMKDFNLNAEFSFITFSTGFRVQAARAGVATPDVIDPFVGTNTFDRVRYVLIPGGVLAGRGTNSIDYTKMSYQEICTKFNIPE